ncbi:MinD/ParA family ATP-binding protein [Streptomyces chrestomyceticus]|uniref:MinD/ParA family ATP-binding protein n=1 Tax=Streptomyces chrestomyceticus TaxID=68185 RepID=UPI0033D9E859
MPQQEFPAAPPRQGTASYPTAPQPEGLHTFDGRRQAATQAAPASPAQWGWRGRVRRLTGGLITPAMGQAEARHRAATEQVQGHLQGPKTIVFVNPKGGAGTTTATLMAARTFGVLRGGSVLAWDNNETRGTLGGRGRPAGHWNTARELLDNIGLFADSATARIGDLGLYVRGQGPAHFDLLASDERPEVTGHIDANEVGRLHNLFQRFYKLTLIDTGNNIRAQNFLAAVHRADLLVVTATVRRDTADAAVWMLDALERRVTGLGELKPKTVTVLADMSPHSDQGLRREMRALFGARTRAVHPIPYDPALADGGIVNYDRLSKATHDAWLFACASMASVLQEQQ